MAPFLKSLLVVDVVHVALLSGGEVGQGTCVLDQGGFARLKLAQLLAYWLEKASTEAFKNQRERDESGALEVPIKVLVRSDGLEIDKPNALIQGVAEEV